MSTPRAANGTYVTNGLPNGTTSLTPHIVVSPAVEAVEFYRTAFGARVGDVTRLPGSDLIAHAILEFASGSMTVSDPLEANGLITGDPEAGATYSLALYVSDVDARAHAAAAVGATLRDGPATFVSGDRFASILDPFGVRWTVMTRVEDVSQQESMRRVAQWAAEQGSESAADG